MTHNACGLPPPFAKPDRGRSNPSTPPQHKSNSVILGMVDSMQRILIICSKDMKVAS